MGEISSQREHVCLDLRRGDLVVPQGLRKFALTSP